mmetsp:Transcript_4845/g.20768  ORF Transcript_4845/g.20768 Transcript_4845/m.20768 type:complete len:238 (-) Transcript_4845:448-1161(-)
MSEREFVVECRLERRFPLHARHCWGPGNAKLLAVPSAHFRLPTVGVPPAVVASVANEVPVEAVHESERTVVEGEAKDAHVVCVEHAVAPANHLPLRHHAGSAAQHLLVDLEDRGGASLGACQLGAWEAIFLGKRKRKSLGRVAVDDVLEECVASVVDHAVEQVQVARTRTSPASCGVLGLEYFERAEPQEGRCHACDDAALLGLGAPRVENVAHDGRVRRDNGTSSGRWDAKGVHRL